MMQDFTPARAAALTQLDRFAARAGRDYAQNRNYDLGEGNHAHVSRLSPYLRNRLISEAEVVDAVLARHAYRDAEKFIQEVFWRTYWKGWLELRPDIWESYQSDLNRAWNDLQTQSGLRANWEAACLGQTEIECFNTWSQELVSTGYIHNHARMWFASIWIFTLKLPWALGADFFLRHLLDGDPASNTLGWRWVAGIQTQGKTYLATASNISKYTNGRFRPDNQLASHAPPLDAPPPPAPGLIPDVIPPDPIKRTGFLLHEEDLGSQVNFSDTAPASIAVLSPQTRFGPLETAPHVARFRQQALTDGRARLKTDLATHTDVETAKDILEWAHHENLEQIVTPYAPVGPVARVLAAVQSTSDAPTICQCMRDYDRMAWPHATRGFFAFKKRLPDFLAQMNAPALI